MDQAREEKGYIDQARVQLMTLNNFGVKIMHVAATTLQIRHREKQKGEQKREDVEKLYQFLANDWMDVLLSVTPNQKGKKDLGFFLILCL